MEDSSGDDSQISDSEVQDYSNKIYGLLKNGKYKVKCSEVSFRCPFCLGKKKHDYLYKDLLQHATGVGASNRKGKEKANHLALARFMKTDLTNEQSGSTAQSGPNSQSEYHTKPANSELFVWPWMGILMNLPREWNGEKFVGESASMVKDQLSKFHPVKAHPLWNYKGHLGSAIIEFGKDWTSFRYAMAFENSFGTEEYGKRGWFEKKCHGLDLYGWLARADDYNSNGPVGDYLRKHGDLKTVSDVEKEESRKNENLLKNLTNEIDAKNQHLLELECKFNETNMFLTRMMDEREKIHQDYNEKMRKMQRTAQDNSRRIYQQNAKLRNELESQQRELEWRHRELDKYKVENEAERRKLLDERKKNSMKSSSLQLATLEQKEVDKSVLRLAEEQKREKEAALQRILKLEEQLDNKQALEMEIEQLRGTLRVMKHMESDDDTVKNKMEEMTKELKEKMGEMDYLEDLNQALLVKERRSNDELQEARKVLIHGLSEMLSGRSIIGIKRMGDLDTKPFQNACKQKFPGEAEEKALETCSLWEENIKDPHWHPFKTVVDGEEVKELIDENDDKLKGLKDEFGGDVFNAVVTAMMEIKEYNPSGGYTVPELWNFRERRKATLKEVILFVLKQWKTNKRKK